MDKLRQFICLFRKGKARKAYNFKHPALSYMSFFIKASKKGSFTHIKPLRMTFLYAGHYNIVFLVHLRRANVFAQS